MMVGVDYGGNSGDDDGNHDDDNDENDDDNKPAAGDYGANQEKDSQK